MIDPVSETSLSNNTAPFFLPAPIDLYAYYGEVFEYIFGDAFDHESEEGQIVTVEADLGEATSFA